MLQRYLGTCARLKTLKATIATTIDHPPADGGSGGVGGSGGGEGGDNNNGSLLAAQVEVVETVLSRDLEGLSEGDLLLIWERCSWRPFLRNVYLGGRGLISWFVTTVEA